MKLAILDDYQQAVRTLACYERLSGHEVDVWTDHTEDIDVLGRRLRDVEAVVLLRGRTPVTAALLDRLPALRFISQAGHTDHIDLDACTRRGVLVSAITASRPSYCTAELAWGLIIASLRNICSEAQALKDGRWQAAPLGLGLRGRTLGVLGYGRLGSIVAGYGQAFGMDVLVWGRESTRAKASADGYATAAGRDEFFRRCDVLSLHVRLNEQTRHMITVDDLLRMKPSALFVNTSRAELVAPGAVCEALRAGRPARAAVDVYETEPATAAEPLLAMDNVLCTPHLGYVERDSHEFAYGNAFDQIVAYAQGRPVNVANPGAIAANQRRLS